MQIKDLTDLNNFDNMKAEKHTTFVNDFDLDLDNDILHSILNSENDIQNLAYQQFQIDSNSSDETLTMIVSKNLSLNQKQQFSIKQVLSKILT